uniref:Uncharacterized protein n=1 Tax=Chromera velia CCMP2878 TaxID=1169474 RepID=A0A0G4IAV2_9ALVE|eukprot:Cvel_2148.t1-p1 / transcript=Cvel_2148.t1 / gene=Cvel_2148 / organism=Chromera_velia_CCMP2878 / gene_product=hypothetical protein / transcript_product=hypothetical protein / location=Cvel_scaffold83:96032-98665(-) / protein_length=321 / sequence_SO=supercontig / SO=protein_coding / is_pseudo=false
MSIMAEAFFCALLLLLHYERTPFRKYGIMLIRSVMRAQMALEELRAEEARMQWYRSLQDFQEMDTASQNLREATRDLQQETLIFYESIQEMRKELGPTLGKVVEGLVSLFPSKIDARALPGSSAPCIRLTILATTRDPSRSVSSSINDMPAPLLSSDGVAAATTTADQVVPPPGGIRSRKEDLSEVKQEEGVARLASASAAAATAAARPFPIVEEPLNDNDEEVPHFEMQLDVLSEANEVPGGGVQAPPAVVEENADEDVMEELFQDRCLNREEALSELSSEDSNKDDENQEEQIRLGFAHREDGDGSNMDVDWDVNDVVQ